MSAYGYYNSYQVYLWLISSFYIGILKALPNASKLSPSEMTLLLLLRYEAIIDMESKNSTLGIYTIFMIDLLNLAP